MQTFWIALGSFSAGIIATYVAIAFYTLKYDSGPWGSEEDY